MVAGPALAGQALLGSRSMRALHLTPLLLVLANSAFGQDVSLQRCRAMAEPAARLACYDALADAPAPPRPPAAAAAPVRPAAAVAAAAPKPADSFGLPRPASEPEEVRSAVGAGFDGWGPNRHIRLDNGQVWQIIDGSSVVLPPGARKVAVKRGALGSFYLDFEGLKTSPRVRRVE